MRLRLVFTAAAAAVFGFLATYFRRFEAVDNSMHPSVADGDYVISTRVGKRLARSSIVVFPHGDQFLVKRVVGVAGDTVRIEAGRVGVNDKVLAEPWVTGAAAGDGTWTVGPGELFVLSDNRTVATSDSREFGPIPVRDGVWRVRWRYWPMSRLGAVD